ncbi:MAG: glycogen/starch synthase [Prevotella sp.]|jgi:glycosyltransferase involved in cell wall biosynthesis|nr:glycogen/starch synthase [Prevotella sp.]MCI1781429.1 glycogen/starch synthase [Prevotella sp.]MCI1802197.1 glycogen/starch synthase [Prevotella sp.]MCI1848572.1 glycogen/starch synthase [Prevotella sp.]MCI2137617.1 glycogen/starch synthase [Prevotella sp.]
MEKNRLFPDYIFESSWEVCNKVGGIYAVLSTRAKTLQEVMKDHIFFIGPDFRDQKVNPYFKADDSLFPSWKEDAAKRGLHIRIGRWLIPGEPITFLVDFQPYFKLKNQLYGRLWDLFRVDSLHGYGDYDEASMFSYASGLVVESFYRFYLNETYKVVYHGNEWMTGLGLLYVHYKLPFVATMFTTHATSIGRSIAGNNKPLYAYLYNYNGDQMAEELNMQSKHSVEKQTAKYVDCFTTVSDITARECKELLDKPVDQVLPNGFEDDFVPREPLFSRKRAAAREKMLEVANALLGTSLDDHTLIVSTSGRYEFRNKGIDEFIEAMNRLRKDATLKRPILAFIDVPGWVSEPRADLLARLKSGQKANIPLEKPYLTHWLHNMNDDRVLSMMNYLNFHNSSNDQVKLIFLPCYLNGQDGIFNMTYYDVILGNDLCVYPSYYEPWGYTPLEAIAFKVSCITTDLAGFGLWVNKELGRSGEIEDGVKVVHRTDFNYFDVADSIMNTVHKYAQMTPSQVEECRMKARELSQKALWSRFFIYYREAYDLALRKVLERRK